MEKLDIFFTEIQNIYEDNCRLKNELEIIKNNSSNNEINLNKILERNKELETLIYNLEQKNSSKTSKMLWENTQQIIQDKDTEIDFLKKKLMFYERQELIKSKTNINITDNNIKELKTDNNIKELKTDNKIKVLLEDKPKKKKSHKKIEIIDDLERDLLAC
jgi:hypothetical protein